jgi:hypothetical protein
LRWFRHSCQSGVKFIFFKRESHSLLSVVLALVVQLRFLVLETCEERK